MASAIVTPSWPIWLRAAITALFITYAVLLLRNTSLAAGGPDESGYMNAARLFADGKIRVEAEPLRRLSLDRSWLPVFTPLGFRSSGDRWIVPAYPPGLPLHLNVAGFYVGPLLALGCVVLTFLLARELGLPAGYAVGASVILAVTPQFILFSLQVMSDVPATFWCLLSILLALRSPNRPLPAVLAGVAFAIGVTVRPSNLLVAIPLLFAARMRGRTLLAMAAGAAPVMAGLLWFQHVAYGGPLTTGYGGVAEVVSFAGFREKFLFYLFWMGRTLSPLVAPAGLFIVLDRKVAGSVRGLLVSWYLVFLTFYCLWGLFDEWWYTRFLLPATPAIIIAALLVVRDLVPVRAVRALLIGIMIAMPWMYASERRVLRIDDDQRVYPGTMAWSAPLLPDDAMVVSGLLSGTFFLYQDRLTARWDQLDSERFAVLRGRASWYAVLSDVEVDFAEFKRRLPGVWTPVSKYRDVTMYRLEP